LVSGCLDSFDPHRVEQSVYRISVVDCFEEKCSSSWGTGFLVKEPNLVLTNYHVVADKPGTSCVRYRNKSGKSRRTCHESAQWTEHKQIYICSLKDSEKADKKREFEEKKDIKKLDGVCASATIKEKDKERDLALLSASDELPGKALPLNSANPDIGTEVRAMGYPFTTAYLEMLGNTTEFKVRFKKLLQSTTTAGTVSRFIDDPKKSLISHQATLVKGNSGGPLFDLCGSVVGVNSYGFDGTAVYVAIAGVDVVKFLDLQGISIGHAGRCLQSSLQQRFQPLAPIVGIAAAILAIMALVVAMHRPSRERITSMITTSGFRRASYGGGRPTDAGADMTGFMPTPSARTGGDGHTGEVIRLMPVGGGSPLTVSLSRLRGQGAILGRDRSSDVVINTRTVSKRHAKLRIDASGRLVVEDLESNNGTWHGDRRVKSEPLADGDTIRFGSAEYRIYLPASLASTSNGASEADATVFMADGRQTWTLSGFDGDGKAVRFSLEPKVDSRSGQLRETVWIVGRKPEQADTVLSDKSVSGAHARVRYSPASGLEICDLNSANGTKVDGQRIDGSFVNIEGARSVEFGGVKLALSRN
jgi:pSer/pThr/pTyr-binding forkhead associated (FHA) protein